MLQWAALLAVCPAIHELIHHDADDEHHDCAVTMFVAGQIDQTPVEPILVPKASLLERLPEWTFETVVASSFFLSCRILEHAPPLREVEYMPGAISTRS